MSKLREDLEALAIRIKPGNTKGRQTSSRYYIPELERYIKALMLELNQNFADRYTYVASLDLSQKAELLTLLNKPVENL